MFDDVDPQEPAEPETPDAPETQEATPDVTPEEGVPQEGEEGQPDVPQEGEEGGEPAGEEGEPGSEGVPPKKTTTPGKESPIPESVLKEKIRYKADGGTMESTVGELIEAGKNTIRLRSEAEKNLREAAGNRDYARQVLSMVHKDPIKTALQLKIQEFRGKVDNPLEAARDAVFEAAKAFILPILDEQEAEKAMSEPERKARALVRRLEWQDQQLQEERNRIQREREASALVLETQRVDQEVSAAIRAAGLKDTPEINDAMLRIMERGFDAGKDLTPADAARIVKAKIQQARLSRRPPPEEVVEDAEYMEALRKAELAKRQKPPARSSNRVTRELSAGSPPAGSNPRSRSDGAKQERISMDELFSPF